MTSLLGLGNVIVSNCVCAMAPKIIAANIASRFAGFFAGFWHEVFRAARRASLAITPAVIGLLACGLLFVSYLL